MSTATHSRRTFLRGALGIAAVAAVGPDLIGARQVHATTANITVAGAGRVEFVTAARVVDSRSGLGNVSRLVPNVDTPATITGLPAGTIAAWVNLTIVRPDTAGQGWAAIWPAAPWPGTSSINFNGANRAILTLVKVDPAGRISLRSNVGCDVLVDVVAPIVAVAGPTAAGRLVPTAAPVRVCDTDFPGGGWQRVALPAGVAAAAGVLVTVTCTGGGYWTVAGAPADGAPMFSTVNPAGGTMTNQTIIPVVDGGIAVYTSTGGHVTIDAVATVTGTKDYPTTTGLIRPLPTPVRILDTRNTDRSPFTHVRELFAGQYVALNAGQQMPVDTTAVIGSVIAVRPAVIGRIKNNKTGNTLATFGPNSTTAGHALIPLQIGGGLEIGTDSACHLVVDVTATLVGTSFVSAAPPQQRGISDRPMPPFDWANARVTIPAIAFDRRCGDGGTAEVLDQGIAAAITGSGLGGTRTSTALAAHRASHGAPLYRIRELAPGDTIKWSDSHRTVTWTVTQPPVLVPADNISPYMPQGTTDPDRITLFACSGSQWQPGPETHRIVVIGTLASVTH